MFGLVHAIKMRLGIKVGRGCKLGTEFARDRIEKAPRRRIVAGNRRLDVRRVRKSRARDKILNHTLAKFLAAGGTRNGDLPDKERMRFIRDQISRNPTNRPVIAFNQNAGFGKMRALKQVAVPGIPVKRRRFSNKFPD